MLFIANLNPEEDTELDDFFNEHCSLAHDLNYFHVFRGTIPGWDASRCKNSVHYAALEFLEKASLDFLLQH